MVLIINLHFTSGSNPSQLLWWLVHKSNSSYYENKTNCASKDPIMICEIFSFCFHLIIGIFARLLSKRFGLQAEKKRKRARRCPSPKYFKARLAVKSRLESMDTNGETKMDGILALLRWGRQLNTDQPLIFGFIYLRIPLFYTICSETITHGLKHGADKTQEKELKRRSNPSWRKLVRNQKCLQQHSVRKLLKIW